MEPINFVYWLQGYLELQDPKTIDAPKVQMIKDHIALVFNKVTPGKTQTPKLGDINWAFTAKEMQEAVIYQDPPASC